MNTCKEYIENPRPRVWLHALDVLTHVLRGDPKATAFKDEPGASAERHLENLREVMSEHMGRDGRFDEMVERTDFRRRRRVPQWDYAGGLDVGAYIDKRERCFVDYQKAEVIRKDGITILIDAGVPWRCREENNMELCHQKAYDIALQAEADGVPCRVIAIHGLEIPEFPDALAERRLVIKDYDDPIFPGIWGAFKNNATTNTFNNVCEDYLIGTSCPGNGTVSRVDVSKDFEDEEVIILEPANRIIDNGKFQRR